MRRKYGPFAMVLWGLMSGIMYGATFGALGGIALGTVFFIAYAVFGDGLTVVGAYDSIETTLVTLISFGTILGSLLGSLVGAVCGPVLGILALCFGHDRRSHLVLGSSLLLALGGLTVGRASGDSIVPQLSTGGIFITVVATILGGTMGAFSGFWLGRTVSRIAWGSGSTTGHGQ